MKLKKRATKTKIQVIAKNPFRGTTRAWIDFGRSLDGLKPDVGRIVGSYDSYVKKMEDFEHNKDKWDRFIKEKCYSDEWGRKRTMDLITEHFELSEGERKWILERIKKWRFKRLGRQYEPDAELGIEPPEELLEELNEAGEGRYYNFLKNRERKVINWNNYKEGFFGSADIVLNPDDVMGLVKLEELETLEGYDVKEVRPDLEECIREFSYVSGSIFIGEHLFSSDFIFKILEELSDKKVFENPYRNDRFLKAREDLDLDGLGLEYYIVEKEGADKLEACFYVYSPKYEIGVLLAERVKKDES